MRTAFQSALRSSGYIMMAAALESLAMRRFGASRGDASSPTGPGPRRRRKLKKYLQDHQRPNRRRK